MNKFDKQFWDDRYLNNQTGWNIGYPSTPIKDYINQLSNKNLKILIPGAGNSYEAEYLFNNGFKDITVLDISDKPLNNLKKRIPDFPQNKLIQDDFFNHLGNYDLIIEQTFFCALNPQLRTKYVSKIHQLLKSNGKLVGLFFDFPLTEQGPPFGGSKKEYLNLFRKKFIINKLEKSYNSISERKGKELFINFIKK